MVILKLMLKLETRIIQLTCISCRLNDFVVFTAALLCLYNPEVHYLENVDIVSIKLLSISWNKYLSLSNDKRIVLNVPVLVAVLQ